MDTRYYPYARLHHTLRVRSGRVYVRLSHILKDAPLNVHRALAFILVAKYLQTQAPPFYVKVYRDYASSPEVLRASERARLGRGRRPAPSAQGRVYNLEKIFRRLNQQYFGGALEQPALTWSQRRTRTLLGQHNDVHGLITISKTLDSEEVPEWFVEYILYHEMLHIKHPARTINGRRYHHTKAFLAEEQRFPAYDEAQELLDDMARQRRTHQDARAA